MVAKKKKKEVTRDRVVKFSFQGKSANSRVTEIVAYPEGVMDEDVEAEFMDWLVGMSKAYWIDVEEGEL